MRNWLRLAVLLAVAAGLFIAGRLVDVDAYILLARETVLSVGYRWAVLVYALMFVVATMLFLPGTPFTILAALLFGPWLAFLVMTVGTTASSAVSFLLARRLGKAWVERHVGRRGKLEQLKALVEHNRAFVIPAIRFLPMFPYSFNNYALGLTDISFGAYMFWSEVVLVPMNIVLILGANALYRALVLGEVSWGLIGGTTAAGLAVLLVGYYAKSRFGQAKGQASGGAD
jgi:uncharacterized membrane protein YdjX (TVP38/TMEM64 family)